MYPIKPCNITRQHMRLDFAIFSSGLFRSCYTDGNGPEVFTQCSTKWIRNSDLSMDEYGDWQLNRSSTLFNNRRVQDNIRQPWRLRKKSSTAKHWRQDLRELPWENQPAEKYLSRRIDQWRSCESISRNSNWVFAHPHRWNQVWQIFFSTSVLRKITQSVNDNRTYCFSTKQGPYGWCATCKVEFFLGILLKIVFFFQRGAKKGERGYCPDQDLPKNPEEVAWPNATEVNLISIFLLNVFNATQVYLLFLTEYF